MSYSDDQKLKTDEYDIGVCTDSKWSTNAMNAPPYLHQQATSVLAVYEHLPDKLVHAQRVHLVHVVDVQNLLLDVLSQPRCMK